MQIKRFEAADMTEALRMVKRDFGDDAVILSAKEVRPGGFFSALKKKHVVITAAIDYQAKGEQAATAFPDLLADQLDEETSADRVSISARRPATDRFADDMPDRQDRNDQDTREHQEFRPEHQEFRRDATSETVPPRPDTSKTTPRGQIPPALSSLRRYGAAQSQAAPAAPAAAAGQRVKRPGARPVAAPFYKLSSPAKQHRIALVGPSGSGKSTTVAKLARHCQAAAKKQTGLISLDRFRMGANGLLENVARIMNLSVVVIRDAVELATVLEDMAGHDVVIIDTPGMGASDQAMMDDVAQMLKTARPDETHLVVNATVREKILAQAVDTFLPLGVNRLLLTHTDELGSVADASDVLIQSDLPAAFYGTGVDLFDGLETVHRENTGHRPQPDPEDASRDGDAARGEVHDAATSRPPVDLNRVKYVANRNSELFHHPTCKSVKRINAENIAAFNSIEQAMDEGFKPCRACCSISSVKKPAFHAFSFQRASAL